MHRPEVTRPALPDVFRSGRVSIFFHFLPHFEMDKPLSVFVSSVKQQPTPNMLELLSGARQPTDGLVCRGAEQRVACRCPRCRHRSISSDQRDITTGSLVIFLMLGKTSNKEKKRA